MDKSYGRTAHGGVERASSTYRTILHSAATRILGCQEAARDAVQDTLITLWLKPPAHDQERAWLVRTVVHRSLHERRTRQRRQHWEREAVDAASEDCRICNADHNLERREVGLILEQALHALPETYRSAFVLREVEGWDYERIARQQNVPMGTVRSRLNRARAALRAHITAALDGEPRCIVSRQRQT
ncbi:MAG: hypothetical protein RL701_1072 [Pseudomonadota bacterium]